MTATKSLSAAFLVLTLLVSGGSSIAQPIGPLPTDERGLPTLAPLLTEVTPGVVNIAVQGRIRVEQNPLYQDPFFRRFFGIPDQAPEREFQSAGSGVIVDAERGYVLTNDHVVRQAEQITVGLQDGRRLPAELIGTDPEADIALLKISADGLVAVPLGDANTLRVGDFVVAIGNPFGLGQTVTSGIVSALERSGLGLEGYENFIQTDAAINPGNSGGALVDLRGGLVGINTAILGPSGGNVGIGFAIPINMAREIVDQLVSYGEVKRGRLGVVVQDLTPELAEAFRADVARGAVIADVIPGSPAEEAGLERGDLIIAVNGIAVRGATHLRNRIGLTRLGEAVELEIVQNGATRKVAVRIGPRG
jgi:serine protease Do/serine protease DegQ